MWHDKKFTNIASSIKGLPKAVAGHVASFLKHLFDKPASRKEEKKKKLRNTVTDATLLCMGGGEVELQASNCNIALQDTAEKVVCGAFC